jgi:hypothetical protein
VAISIAQGNRLELLRQTPVPASPPRVLAAGDGYTGRRREGGRSLNLSGGSFVPLLVHLTGADIRRYVAGVPRAETDRHVRVCAYCAQRLGDTAQRAVWWERRGLLGRLVRVDPSQMIDELLTEIEAKQRPHAA